MKPHLIFLILCICSTQIFYCQQDDGVVSFALPVRNSLTFNRFAINPTFSFVREQNKTISFFNKREWVQFENAPNTYLASYSGRFGENIGAGLGVFQQNYGILTTFGGVFNVAYNITLSRDSNLTFGLNLAAYSSGVNTANVVTNFDDPSLQNVPSNFLISVNPGINYGTDFLDFGVSVNNLLLYNLQSSTIIEDNAQQGIQAHVMYTGYMDSSGFFDESKFSGLIRSEFRKDDTIISGLAMLTVPAGIWAQIGYNTLYGASGGLGINLTDEIAIEYNFEKGLGDFMNFGPSHEISLAYRFKSRSSFYNSSSDDEITGLFSNLKGKKAYTRNATPRSKQATSTSVKKEAVKQPDIATKETISTEPKVEADIEAQRKLEAEQKAKDEADAKAIIEAEQKAKATAQLRAKLEAEQKAKAEAEAQDKLNAQAEAQRLAEKKAQEQAEAKAKLEAEQLKAQTEARLLAEKNTKAEAEANAKLEAERVKLMAEQKAIEEAENKARQLEEEKAKAEASKKAEEELITNPKDELSQSMLALSKQTEEAKTKQTELISQFEEVINIKDQDLKDLKEENDLSEQGVAVEPKPFKSITEENNKLNNLKVELDNIIENRTNKIKELQSLYDDMTESDTLTNSVVLLHYKNTIRRLTSEQANAVSTRNQLETRLQSIKVATEFERRRRIKRAAFNNEDDRYTQDRAVLNDIINTTPLSKEPLTSQEFDFGEERSKNIEIVKNIKNAENGYYLIIAVHNSTDKRDNFLKKVVASGRYDVDFFYDVNSSKYYIYYKKTTSVEEANQLLKTKGDKPYNINMSIIKIEN